MDPGLSPEGRRRWLFSWDCHHLYPFICTIVLVHDSRLRHLNLIKERWPSLVGNFLLYLSTCFLGLFLWDIAHRPRCDHETNNIDFISKGQAAVVFAKLSIKEVVVLLDLVTRFRCFPFVLLVPCLGTQDVFCNQQAVNEWASSLWCLFFNDMPSLSIAPISFSIGSNNFLYWSASKVVQDVNGTCRMLSMLSS